ncbi:hypothetical protein, partial [Igneacidithiobacillus copahuensis]|uniref:hypothetical protein n=1 Tax=Igneacidithiobacillus copahuensis TaxID=2724909 RepID=UPI001C07D906
LASLLFQADISNVPKADITNLLLHPCPATIAELGKSRQTTAVDRATHGVAGSRQLGAGGFCQPAA